MIKLATDIDELRPRICVIGVGGGGGNAIANMMRSDVRGVEFIAVNTDAQALRNSPADQIVQLGRSTTEGLGAGSRPEVGKAAAEQSLAEIEDMLEGMHMCFIAAGMGGGTGSGAAPVIARAARDKGILTVGVVTQPFDFEGRRRARTAALGLQELRQYVDTLIVIPNQNLFRIATCETTFKAAFALADEVLQKGVRGITDLMTMPGLINLHFADLRTVMTNTGNAVLGVGEAIGDGRAIRAAEQAISNPLLDDAIKGATGLIISITGSDDIGLWEIEEIAGHFENQVDPDAEIIWGSAFDQSLAGMIRVSVVATGIDSPPVSSSAAFLSVGLPGPQQVPPSGVRTLELPFDRNDALPTRAEHHACSPSEGSSRAPANDTSLPRPGGRIQLVPPQGPIDSSTIDPFAGLTDVAPAPLPSSGAASGLNLFERMAMAARFITKEAREIEVVRPTYGHPPLPSSVTHIQSAAGASIHSRQVPFGRVEHEDELVPAAEFA